MTKHVPIALTNMSKTTYNRLWKSWGIWGWGGLAGKNQSVQDRAGEALGGPKANVSIYEARFESKVRF
jgi:hypothetical protein